MIQTLGYVTLRLYRDILFWVWRPTLPVPFILYIVIIIYRDSRVLLLLTVRLPGLDQGYFITRIISPDYNCRHTK